MTAIDDYVNEIESKFPPDMFIGRLAWYSVSMNSTIHIDELTKIIEDTGAPITVPAAPKAHDIFRRACTAAEQSKVTTENPDEFHNYVVTGTGKDEDYIYQQVVVETVDYQGHTLAHQIVADVRFERASEQVFYDELVEHDGNDSVSLAIYTYMDTMQGMITSYILRISIQRALEDRLNAVPVRDGGAVYFTGNEQLAALEEAVNRLPQASLHTLPLVNTEKQNGMVRAAFRDDTLAEADKLVGEVAAIIKGNKHFSPEKAAAFQMRFKGLRTRLKEYAEILDDNLGDVETRLDVFGIQIKTMIENLD